MTKPFGPKPAEHPSVGTKCPICGVPFAAGDMTTLVPIRPADEEEAERHKAGRAYTAVGREIHAACEARWFEVQRIFWEMFYQGAAP